MVATQQLGERLRIARSLAGISARELDRLAGRSVGHAALIERGDRPRVEAETAAAYARVLDVDLNWLITGSGEKPLADSVVRAVDRAKKRAA